MPKWIFQKISGDQQGDSATGIIHFLLDQLILVQQGGTRGADGAHHSTPLYYWHHHLFLLSTVPEPYQVTF